MTAPLCCIPKRLPVHLRLAAAATAIRQNSLNRPDTFEPQHLALMTTKYWGVQGATLTVAFLDGAPADLQSRILRHMNAWSAYCNVRFVLASPGSAQVRIARVPGSGYWSFLGTDILHIPADRQTMNLDSFTMNTPESEFVRVVRHETGHTLGFPHEHMRRELIRRLDPRKTVLYFMQTQGWTQQEVVQQVLTPLDEASLRGTPHADQDSIMCYQIPGELTVDGSPITGGVDIDPLDVQFAASIYPLPGGPVAPPVNPVPPPEKPPVPPVTPSQPISLPPFVKTLVDQVFGALTAGLTNPAYKMLVAIAQRLVDAWLSTHTAAAALLAAHGLDAPDPSMTPGQAQAFLDGVLDQMIAQAPREWEKSALTLVKGLIDQLLTQQASLGLTTVACLTV